MPPGRYVSTPLTSQHALSGFECGVPELDDWLIRSALQAAANNTARTFVWTDDGRVVAYYALAGHQIERETVPGKVARGSPVHIPAVILGKLALARHLHGTGLGAELLVDALERVLVATQNVAARVVVVDAVDERAVRFYERFGFLRTGPDSRRLVRKLADIARDFQ